MSSSDIDRDLYLSLAKVYGSLTRKLISKLHEPPSRLYVRVNTVYVDRDDLVDLLRSRGLNPRPDPHLNEAIYFDVDGPFKVDVTDKKICVDKKAAESIMYGANLYAPGVVDYDEFKVGDELTVVSPNGVAIAVVRASISSSELRRARRGLVGINVRSLYRAPAIREMPEYSSGLIYPQSLPSMVVAKVLDPEPGERVIDMNAAPGGKASHIVQLTRGRALLIAIDRSVNKVRQLADTLNRLRLFKNVLVLPMDSRYADVDLNAVNRVDKVLVDPPCTSLGVRPKVAINKSYRSVVDASNYQVQFLRSACKLVREGGLIVYSTCTLTLEENESVSLRAISECGLEPIDLGSLPYSSRVEYGDLIAYRYSPLDYDMPGYYIVALRKRK